MFLGSYKKKKEKKRSNHWKKMWSEKNRKEMSSVQILFLCLEKQSKKKFELIGDLLSGLFVWLFC